MSLYILKVRTTGTVDGYTTAIVEALTAVEAALELGCDLDHVTGAIAIESGRLKLRGGMAYDAVLAGCQDTLTLRRPLTVVAMQRE